MSGAALPEGWSIKRLDELARVTSGKRLPKGRRLSAVQTDHPYIRVTDMFMGGVDSSGIQYVPDDVFPEIAQFTVAAGDIFISCAGTLGLVGLVPDSLNGANLTENANRIWSIQCDRQFLLSVLMSGRIQSVIQNIQTVGAQPKLALGRIRSFEIPCPDKTEEQQAIAAALSDADGVVAGLERVIAKKRLIKQGAMQDLLTARRRLPGFSGEWEVKKLGELLANVTGGGTPSRTRAEFWNGPIPWMTVKDFATGSIGGTLESITTEGLKNSASSLVNAGTLILCTRMAVGKTAIMDVDVAINQDLKALVFKPGTSSVFVKRMFELMQKQIEESAGGSTVKGISIGDVRAMEFPLPSADEQQAIAAVLSDMDTEIQTLESRLVKAREVKEGMMQNLLTGRVRLV